MKILKAAGLGSNFTDSYKKECILYSPWYWVALATTQFYSNAYLLQNNHLRLNIKWTCSGRHEASNSRPISQ